MAAAQYDQSEFDGDKPNCDLVMKGGITSGVVYPLAVTELAKSYRLRAIGGTSAGAVAAGITAAAELNRAGGGYGMVADIPNELGDQTKHFFQPSPELRPLFDMMMAVVDAKSAAGKIVGILRAMLRGYWGWALMGTIPALLLAAATGGAAPSWLEALAILLVLGIGVAGMLAWRIAHAVLKEIPDNGYGICPCMQQPGNKKLALTDWTARKLEIVSGRAQPEGEMPKKPLTFGDLIGEDAESPAIDLQIMTTNLAIRRPYRLPFKNRRFFFREDDFRRLFPDFVVDWMVETCRRYADDPAYLYFPENEDLPVIVAIRMSFSVPGFVCQVPLYTRDFTLSDRKEQLEMRPCWFSDGAVSSNFPIHFFDHFWPNTPTFGITLDAFDPARNGAERVFMPENALSGILLPVEKIDGLGAYIGSVLGSATDWQDNLQSTLPGYRERIVHIALDEKEGGFNINMPPELIDTLVDYGAQAGRRMTDFDLHEHRWRRFLVSFARLEAALEEMHQAYREAPPEGDCFKDFLMRYPSQAKSYRRRNSRDWDKWIAEVVDRTEALMKRTGNWATDPLRKQQRVPRPDSDMRITPKV